MLPTAKGNSWCGYLVYAHCCCEDSLVCSPILRLPNSMAFFQACLFWLMKWLCLPNVLWKIHETDIVSFISHYERFCVSHFDNTFQPTYSLLFRLIVPWLEHMHLPRILQNALTHGSAVTHCTSGPSYLHTFSNKIKGTTCHQMCFRGRKVDEQKSWII